MPERVHDKNLQGAGFAGLFWQKYHGLIVEELLSCALPEFTADEFVDKAAEADSHRLL